MELFAGDECVDHLSFILDTPSSKVQEFRRIYKNSAQRKEAHLHHYIHNHPLPSWERIVFFLRASDLLEHAAMVEKTYIRGMTVVLQA